MGISNNNGNIGAAEYTGGGPNVKGLSKQRCPSLASLRKRGAPLWGIRPPGQRVSAGPHLSRIKAPVSFSLPVPEIVSADAGVSRRKNWVAVPFKTFTDG